MSQISIIVPVFKSELYLKRCIDSILCQTFTNYELLLIDDGSPDSCPEICDEYARKDERIKVIHKKNAGVAAARNSGLDIATGEYVTFVDSDDWIEPDMYQSMMDIARTYECDVVMCDCVKDYDNRSEIYTHDIRSGYYNYEQLKKEYYPHLLMMENVEYPATISNCLLLLKRKLAPRYIEGVRFSEDLLYGAQLIFEAGSFFYMKGKCFYHYVMNPTSVTHTFTIDKWNDYLKLHAETEKFFLKQAEYDFRYQIDLMLLFFVYNAIGNIKGTGLLTKMEKKRMISEILNQIKVRKMFQRICVYKLPISWGLKVYTYAYKFRIGYEFLLLKG